MGNSGTDTQRFTAGPVRLRVKWTHGQDHGWLEVTPDHIAFLTSPAKAWASVILMAAGCGTAYLPTRLFDFGDWALFWILGVGLLVALPLLHRASRYTKKAPAHAVTELRFDRGQVQTVTLQLPRRETFRGTSRPLEIWSGGECQRFDLLMEASDIRALGDHLAAWYPTDVAIMPPLSVKRTA